MVVVVAVLVLALLMPALLALLMLAVDDGSLITVRLDVSM